MIDDEWIEEFHKAAMSYRQARVDSAPDAFEKLVAIAKQAATRDSERYRWLRDVSVPPHNFYISVPEEFKDVKYSKAAVDREIDRAIAAATPKGDVND